MCTDLPYMCTLFTLPGSIAFYSNPNLRQKKTHRTSCSRNCLISVHTFAREHAIARGQRSTSDTNTRRAICVLCAQQHRIIVWTRTRMAARMHAHVCRDLRTTVQITTAYANIINYWLSWLVIASKQVCKCASVCECATQKHALQIVCGWLSVQTNASRVPTCREREHTRWMWEENYGGIKSSWWCWCSVACRWSQPDSGWNEEWFAI